MATKQLFKCTEKGGLPMI